MDELLTEKTDLTGLENGQSDIEAKVDAVKTDTESIETKSDTIISDIGDLQSDTTIIKSDSAKSKASTDYIVDLATGGLGTTTGSLAYGVAEIDRHLHSYARFFEAASSPSGETHIADELGYGAGPFQINAGDNDFGAWVQVVGSSDTPFAPGQEFYDFHELQIEGTGKTSTYIIQISFGETGDQGIASKTYSTRPYTPQTNQIDSSSILTQAKRQPVGAKVWMRCKCRGETSGTLDFVIGFHEYEG